VRSDEEVRGKPGAWVKTDYHLVGRCAMGHDEEVLVHAQWRVRGLAGRRVIDAAIRPRLISGNSQAPSIMVGEQCAAIMLAGRVVSGRPTG
jgi:choline dehydrogenase